MSERFSLPGEQSELPLSSEQSLLHEARTVAHDILSRSPDAFSREVAEKILVKADIKDHVDQLVDGADDVTTHQEYKRLGIFVVRDAIAAFDYHDEQAGLDLRQGDSYLDLHIPPIPEGMRSRTAVEASLGLIDEYIKVHELEPKYFLGVTYERMARFAARRFGFSVVFPSAESLPPAVIRGIQRVYNGFTESGKNARDMGLPAIVFKSVKQEGVDKERIVRAGNHMAQLLLENTSA